MKIYGEDSCKKSWALGLIDTTDKVLVSAVDSETGCLAANLITFTRDGEVYPCPGAREAFEVHGYDPHEHGNSFTNSGALEIK